MSHSNFDIGDDDLSGLTEEQLAELSDFIDPEASGCGWGGCGQGPKKSFV